MVKTTKIPKDWEINTIESLAANEKYAIKRGPFGGSLKKEIFVSSGYKVYEQKNAIKDDFDIGTYYITEKKFNELKAFAVKKGDVIISCSGTFGKAAIVPSSAKPGIINQALLKITLNKNKILPGYFKYFFDSKTVQNEFAKLTYGSAIKNVTSVGFIKKMKVPTPPIETQKRIISIIEAARETITLREKAYELTNQLLQSAFLDMFGDPLVDKRPFPLIRLGSLGNGEKRDIRFGPFGSQLKINELTEEGIQVLGIENIGINQFINTKRKCITQEKYQQLKGFSVFPGDVIVTGMGTVGRVCVIPVGYPLSIISSHLFKISLNLSKANPVYIASSIAYSPYIKKQVENEAHGAIMDGLNTTILKNLELYLPSIELQNKFAKMLEQVKAAMEEQEKSRQEIENLFNALQQKAFTGELVT